MHCEGHTLVLTVDNKIDVESGRRIHQLMGVNMHQDFRSHGIAFSESFTVRLEETVTVRREVEEVRETDDHRMMNEE